MIKNKLFDYAIENESTKDMFDQINDVYEQFDKVKELGCVPQKLQAPLFGMWEITAKCPQNCIYCYNSSPRKADELTSKQLFDVADQIIDMKFFNMCVTGGEPTMRPEYFQLVRYLATNGVQVGTVLSGANLNSVNIKRVARYATVVQLSLDGSKAEIHDKVRRRDGSFNDVINAIKYFVSQGVAVKISFASTKYNIDDFENVYNLCNELGVSELRTQKLAVSGKVKGREGDICASEEQYRRQKEFIDSHKKSILRYGDASVHMQHGLRTGIVLMMRITADGNVGITPYADIFFGNVKEQPLKEIFKNMASGWADTQVRKCLMDGTISTDNEIIRDNLTDKMFVK
ncbi:radical SAM/SPASM domain-containing protein [[Clostridium] polysaccharolyticum]|uniref:Radical SAM superfamily enzyme, MoaA/NifB/PqqE/SkfB family n=1 Tax=[Clostridium] polysaccharolyticum TaxID=29364 RepID=A0A1I0DQ15_9FIRM|nr:radical SAM protein [[Clostridium] polysaccharolyticum]SET34635.1 Radical SAM superfamily enzyme, MoaA/NifB/PqqE/SkfB family [[Clostridium] polysaccharolyticum]